jgi:hypothetical protein
MAVGDVYEVNFQAKVRGEFVNNVLHLVETQECTDMVAAHSLATALLAQWIPDWAALLSQDVVFAAIYARRIKPTFGPTHTELVTTPGGVAEDAIPSGSALVISWVTATASKSGRGRTYFAGVPEDAQAGGSITTAAATSWDDFAELLQGNVDAETGDTGQWALAVYSRKNQLAYDIITHSVRTNLAQQRGRRQRPGTS